MRERETHIDLLPDTRNLLNKVEDISRHHIRLIPDSSLELAPAKVRVARQPIDAHEIRFHPEDPQSVDHLIAHECGHLFRTWSAPPQERYLAVVGSEERSAAQSKLQSHLEHLRQAGLSDTRIRQVLDTWHLGTVRQLTNAVADLRIEQWIYNEYPMLRESQRHSIQRILQDYVSILTDAHTRTTPPAVRKANSELNVAAAHQYARLFCDRSFLDRYSLLVAYRGGRLLSQALGHPDPGHRGDCDLTDQWAKRYGLRDWYRWIALDQVGNFGEVSDFRKI